MQKIVFNIIPSNVCYPATLVLAVVSLGIAYYISCFSNNVTYRKRKAQQGTPINFKRILYEIRFLKDININYSYDDRTCGERNTRVVLKLVSSA